MLRQLRLSCFVRMLSLVQLWLPLALKVPSDGWPRMLRGAFSAEECDAIVRAFLENTQEEVDHREQQGIARVNRWDAGNRLRDAGMFDGVYGRIAGQLGVPDLPIRQMVDFTLMHEFTPEHSFFGWHVDTSPADGKWRTLNVNVMLSNPGVDFRGGQLQVGATNVTAVKGDAYLYPAAFPHTVHDLEGGLRRTLVIALADPQQDAARREEYFAGAEANLQQLTSGPLSGESKLHLIHAEFLEAAGRDEAESFRARCLSFKVTEQAEQYAEHFALQGAKALRYALAAGGGADAAEALRAAREKLDMAECVQPGAAAESRELLQRATAEGRF